MVYDVSVRSEPEENEYRKRPPFPGVRFLKPSYDSLSFINEFQDISAVKGRVRVVVGDVAFTLHHNEQFSEVLYIRRESAQRFLVGAAILDTSVFQGAICLTPRALTSVGSGCADQAVCAALGQSMEHSVVCRAH